MGVKNEIESNLYGWLAVIFILLSIWYSDILKPYPFLVISCVSAWWKGDGKFVLQQQNGLLRIKESTINYQGRICL